MSRLYDTQRWKRARRQFLAENPLCRMCREVGKTRLAVLVDHIQPHRGDPEKFWDPGYLQPLCRSCHDGPKQALEKGGRVRGCDRDGRPLDPAHPWNAKG